MNYAGRELGLRVDGEVVVGSGLGAMAWSLGIFALCVYVLHGILVLGEDERSLAT